MENRSSLQRKKMRKPLPVMILSLPRFFFYFFVSVFVSGFSSKLIIEVDPVVLILHFWEFLISFNCSDIICIQSKFVYYREKRKIIFYQLVIKTCSLRCNLLFNFLYLNLFLINIEYKMMQYFFLIKWKFS